MATVETVLGDAGRGARANDAPRPDVGAAAYLEAIDAFADVAAAVIRPGCDIDTVLHLVARKICGLVHVTRCSIHLRDADGTFRGRVGHARRDIDADVKRARAGMPADGITREILRTKTPVIIADARSDPRAVQATVRFWGIRSIMAVPMILADEVIGIIFLDDEDRRRSFSQTDQAIASAFGALAAAAVSHAETATSKAAALDSAARQIRALERAAAVDERLIELVLAGADMQALTSVLAELLGKPCAVYSADGRRVAVASPSQLEDGVVPRLLEAATRHHPEVAAALAKRDPRRAVVVDPIVDAGFLHRHLVAPIDSGDGAPGTLVAMEHLSRFATSDSFVVHRAAALMGLQITLERAAAQAEWRTGASLIAELVATDSDRLSIHRRAEYLGVDLAEPHRICVIRRSVESGGRLRPDQVRVAFAKIAPDLQITGDMLGNDVAVLVRDPRPSVQPASPGGGIVDLTEQACRRISPDGGVVAGVSPVCTDLAGYPDAYTAARQALHCLLRFRTDRSDPVISADELGPSRLFLAALDSQAAATFAAAGLGPLVADPANAYLVRTLQAFFAELGNIRACARALGLHENTVRYRLSRIDKLTGLPVATDPDALITTRVALLVLRLQGAIERYTPSALSGA